MGRSSSAWSTAALTAAALVGFASNSILCRMALAPRLIDAASFTTIRLGAGALALALLARASNSPSGGYGASRWMAAILLFTYAAAFSFAYLRLSAGTGAIVLFGAVQATMIGWGLISGERLRRIQWVGFAAALGGLVLLTLPGLTAPDTAGLGLMALAGASWGVYSILGKGAGHPLSATAANFLLAFPFAAAASLLPGLPAHTSTRGVVLAAGSGAIASGLGYVLWYAALKGGLTSLRAGVVQLAVPVLTAAGGRLVLNETITPRMLVAAAVIFGGVLITTLRPMSIQNS